MLVDLAAFSAENFDAKAWINAASTAHAPDELPEKYLTELEMKLQLLSGEDPWLHAPVRSNAAALALQLSNKAIQSNQEGCIYGRRSDF